MGSDGAKKARPIIMARGGLGWICVRHSTPAWCALLLLQQQRECEREKARENERWFEIWLSFTIK